MSQDRRAADIYDRAGDFFTASLMGENTPALQALSVETYRALVAGAPVADQALAARTGLSVTTVASLLARHPASTIERDAGGAIIAFNGLSQKPTAHRFEVDGHALYVWCVFDALFLPQVLAETAKLSANCPMTGEEIEVGIVIDRVDRIEPTGIVMSMVAPERQACRDDLRGAFCNRVSFFRDRNAFARATDGRADVAALDVEEALSLACRRNRLRYPDLVLPSASRKT